MLSQELYLVTHTAPLLNLPRDAIHSVNDRGVGTIEGMTDGLQGFVSVFAAEVHSQIPWIHNALFAGI